MLQRFQKLQSLCLCFAAALLLLPACDAPVADEGTETPALTTTSGGDEAAASTEGEAAEATDFDESVTVIGAGPDAAKEAQEALILAEAGDVIEFGEGKFEFSTALSLDGTDDITIRGQGIGKTILDFSKQQKGSGGEGIRIKSNHFLIEDLTIQDSPGDSIKVTDSTGVTFRRVRTWWSNGPDSNNGAYGFYPVLCKQVLIEHCVAEHASDAGIYVGQTEQAVVRYNRVIKNVGGIQIENTIGADVYENEATGNTAGLLVFSLPGLTIVNGEKTRLYRNKVYDNNHENFATAATISFMPPGIGVIIQANDNVEIFDNDIHGNNTANCAVVTYTDPQGKEPPKGFDIYPEGIYIHDNKFADGGTNPSGPHADLYRSVEAGPMPDITWDGLTDPKKMVDGKLPDELGLRISNNGDATFVNLNMSTVLSGGEPELIKDISLYEGKFESLPAVTFPGVE